MEFGSKTAPNTVLASIRKCTLLISSRLAEQWLLRRDAFAPPDQRLASPGFHEPLNEAADRGRTPHRLKQAEVP